MIKKIRQLKPRKVKELMPDNLAEKASSILPAKKDETTVPSQVPTITNETIAEHREAVLKGARKYIYPLQHSKHRIIVVTTTLALVTAIFFLTYCVVGLYRFHQNNAFLYRVTQVIPFPVARVNGSFVDYENYLFELRHYVHYYEHQLQRNFDGEDKPQLVQFRKQALTDVANAAYVKQLAKQNHVSVSEKEVNDRINEVREQNRLGNNNKVFADVLRDYWGWSVNDFRRTLKQQILEDKVVAKLDIGTTTRANNAINQLKSGADFAEVAKQVSDDTTTKANGGDFGGPINKTNPNIPPQVVSALFSLKPGQYSGIINTGSTLEIVKVNQVTGDSVSASHISFKLKDISAFTDPVRKAHPPKNYISV
jgi:hypothetical protein